MKNIVAVREGPCAQTHLLAEEIKIRVVRDIADEFPGREDEVPGKVAAANWWPFDPAGDRMEAKVEDTLGIEMGSAERAPARIEFTSFGNWGKIAAENGTLRFAAAKLCH